MLLSEPLATENAMKLMSLEADDVLCRLISWLVNVTEDQYQGKLLMAKVPYGQTPGRHVRHCLDHYFSFINTMRDATALDYEHRRRDVELELCPKRALEQLEHIRSVCAVYFTGSDRFLCMAHVTDHGCAPLATTLARECVFLTQHCIHHMAMIELLMTLQEGDVPDGFSVNASTRRYEIARSSKNETLPCAP